MAKHPPEDPTVLQSVTSKEHLKRRLQILTSIKAGLDSKFYPDTYYVLPYFPQLKIGPSQMQSLKSLPLLAAFAVSLMVSAVNPGFAQESTSPLLAFEDIDTDKDAAVSASEALSHQNAAFATFDENKDGSLVVTEFLSTRLGAASLGFFAPRTFDLKSEHFELWNRNGDDVLSEVEFAAGGLAAFAELDTNGDSRLDENEFKARLAQ